MGFCKRKGWQRVPGRDEPWSISPLEAYFQWRSNTNNVRSLRGIRSKLKHCSLCYGHILPSAQGEGPTGLRKQLDLVLNGVEKRHKREAKKAGRSSEPKRSLALGKVAVGMLFSAHGATSSANYRRLHRPTRHWLETSVCMHSAAMRFQLIRELRKHNALRWSRAERTYRMAADWDKMKRKGAYTIPFPAAPRYHSLKYHWYDETGRAQGDFTAATILHWHQQIAKETGDTAMFSPLGEACPSQAEFQSWLRESFRAMLSKGNEVEIEALIGAMTPHSFRAGLAGDLVREGIPRRVIMKHGRWMSSKAMEQYTRDALAQRLYNYEYIKIKDSARLHETAMQAVKQQISRKRKSKHASQGLTKRKKSA